MKKNYRIVGMPFFLCASIITPLFAADPVESIVSPGAIFELLVLNRDLPTPVQPKYRSPIDLVSSPDGRYIYICEQSAKRIAVFDVAAGAVQRYILLPNEVTGCAVAPDGKRLYATCSSDLWPAGMACVVNVADGHVVSRIAAGSGVRAPVITSDGKTLVVCNRFDNDVSFIDVAARRLIATVAAGREPYCAAITPDGKTAIVGNLLSVNNMNDSMITSHISIIDVPSATVKSNIRLTRGSTSIMGIALSPDGKYAFATHIIGHFNLIGTMVDKGWLHTNNVAVIDIQGNKLVNDICLDRDSLGAGNPWGIRCTKDGKHLVVALAGCNELALFRLPEMMDTVLSRSRTFFDMQKDFSLIRQTGTRIPVTTKGPRSCAIVGQRVFTAGYFDDSAAIMEAFSLSDSSITASRYQIGDPQLVTGERIGEGCFYDATLCFQKWQSCSSCHPFGRNDGLNWILGGAATAAPKNTKSLECTWWMGSPHWAGIHGGPHQAIVAAIELELFRQPTNEYSLPLDTFLMRMQPVPSPMLIKGRPGEAAERGKTVFGDRSKSDCSKCHVRPLFTDINYYWNTGIPDPYDPTMSWKTPSLIEAWRTGPYGHIGTYGTIREIFLLPSHGGSKTSTLTDREIDDLAAFVKSL